MPLYYSHFQVTPAMEKIAKLFTPRQRKRLYRGAVRKGANYLKKEIELNLLAGGVNEPKDSVLVKPEKTYKALYATYAVGVSSDRWWLVFKEFGRSEVLPKKAKILRMYIKGEGWLFRPRADALAAQPFFRPAVDGKGRKALETVHVEFLKIAKREVKLLAGPYKKFRARAG